MYAFSKEIIDSGSLLTSSEWIRVPIRSGL